MVDEIIRAERKKRQMDVERCQGEIDARKMNPYVMNLRQMMQAKRAREEHASKAKGRGEEFQKGVTLDEQLDRLCSKFKLDR